MDIREQYELARDNFIKAVQDNSECIEKYRNAYILASDKILEERLQPNGKDNRN